MDTGVRLLPVHCCCEPWMRLGWVPVPVKYERGAWIVFWPAPWRSISSEPTAALLEGRITTMVATLVFADGTAVDAVKSGHVPLEVWREVPGFVEDTEAAR